MSLKFQCHLSEGGHKYFETKGPRLHFLPLSLPYYIIIQYSQLPIGIAGIYESNTIVNNHQSAINNQQVDSRSIEAKVNYELSNLDLDQSLLFNQYASKRLNPLGDLDTSEIQSVINHSHIEL